MVTWNELMNMTVEDFGPFVECRSVEIDDLKDLTKEQIALSTKKATELYFQYQDLHKSTAVNASSLNHRLQDLVERQYDDSDCESLATTECPSPIPDIPESYYESEKDAAEALIALNGRPCYDISQSPKIFDDPGPLSDILTYWHEKAWWKSKYQILETQKRDWEAFISKFRELGLLDKNLESSDVANIQQRRNQHGLPNETSTFAAIKNERKLQIWILYQDLALQVLENCQQSVIRQRERTRALKEECHELRSHFQELWDLEEFDPFKSLYDYSFTQTSSEDKMMHDYDRKLVAKSKLELALTLENDTTISTEHWLACTQLAFANAQQRIRHENRNRTAEAIQREAGETILQLETMQSVIQNAPEAFKGHMSKQSLVTKFADQLREAELQEKASEDARWIAACAEAIAGSLSSNRKKRLHAEQQQMFVAWTEQQRVELELELLAKKDQSNHSPSNDQDSEPDATLKHEANAQQRGPIPTKNEVPEVRPEEIGSQIVQS